MKNNFQNIFCFSLLLFILSLSYSTTLSGQRSTPYKDKISKSEKKRQAQLEKIEQKRAAKSQKKAEKKQAKKKLSKADQLIQKAQSLKGAKYKYGGTTPSGFDCSGFVQYVFKAIIPNLSLPRTSKAQAREGKAVSKRQAQKGDLIFFGKGKRRISHVGMVISRKGEPLRFIHASSSGVNVTQLDQSDYYKKRFVTIRRVL